MENESFNLKGHVRIFTKKIGEEFKLIDEQDNLIVTRGRELTMSRLASSASHYLTHFGVGSSLVTQQMSDINLISQADIINSGSPQKAFESAVDSGTKFTFDLRLNSAQPSDQPGELSEVGLFTAISGGSMFSRVVHVPFTKNDEVEVKYIYDVEYI